MKTVFIFSLPLTILLFLLGIFLGLEFYAQRALTIPPKPYLRIVSLAPSFCETLEALGESHRLIGITVHSQIRGAEKIAKIGSFAQPNLEAIISLSPDLVLAVPHVMATNTIKELRNNNIEVFSHQPNSIEDIKYIILELAKKFNIKQKGHDLIDKLDKSILEAKKALPKEGDGNNLRNKTILIAVSHSPLVVAGKNTFSSQIIESLGLKNLSQDSKVSWPIWPLEKLLSDPPDFFLLSQGLLGLGHFQELFKSLDLKNYQSMLLVPKESIFFSPSPNLLKDIKIFSELIKQNGYNEPEKFK